MMLAALIAVTVFVLVAALLWKLDDYLDHRAWHVKTDHEETSLWEIGNRWGGPR